MRTWPHTMSVLLCVCVCLSVFYSAQGLRIMYIIVILCKLTHGAINKEVCVHLKFVACTRTHTHTVWCPMHIILLSVLSCHWLLCGVIIWWGGEGREGGVSYDSENVRFQMMKFAPRVCHFLSSSCCYHCHQLHSSHSLILTLSLLLWLILNNAQLVTS